MSTSVGYDVEGMYDKMTEAVDNANTAVTAHEVDENNQKSMLELQRKIHNWTLATQMQSNTIKAIQDGIKGVVANIR